MSDPVATPEDLGIFLGLESGTVDIVRAAFLIAQAQKKCERIVSPITADAQDIVLEVAGRAYNNVTSASQIGLGSAYASFASTGVGGVGGLYLTRANKAELRLIAGRGSAFSADTLPKGVNAVQSVSVSATSGTFTLAFAGSITTALAFNASAAVVQAALEALGSIGASNVAVASSVAGAYTVTFTGRLGTYPMPMLTADGSGLAGGTVAVTSTTTGVAGPGQDLPPWDFDYRRSSRTLGSQIYGGW